MKEELEYKNCKIVIEFRKKEKKRKGSSFTNEHFPLLLYKFLIVLIIGQYAHFFSDITSQCHNIKRFDT